MSHDHGHRPRVGIHGRARSEIHEVHAGAFMSTMFISVMFIPGMCIPGMFICPRAGKMLPPTGSGKHFEP